MYRINTLVIVWLLLVVLMTGCYRRDVISIEKDSVHEYTLTEYTFTEETSQISKEIKYPQLSSEDDYYKDINKLIVDSINEFDIFSFEREEGSGIKWSFWNSYKVIEQSADRISIIFVVTSYAIGNASPSDACYGLNLDLSNGKVVKLDEKVDSMDTIINAVNDEKYTAEYGVFTQMSKEEILDEIVDVINEKDFDTYKYNFYMANDTVNMIVNDVIGSDYGIISLQ